MVARIVECVPNISEGRDEYVINQLKESICAVEGVHLLAWDRGRAANRTVFTFVGSPQRVIVAAYNLIQQASFLIDMQKHHGEHPRIGVVDVCPLVPLVGISMAETVLYARWLANKIGNSLHIPVYCYGEAASVTQRRSLASIRKGGYEALAEKISMPQWKPDYGPAVFVPRSGAVVIGARKMLLAYNCNISGDVQQAKVIAAEIRAQRQYNTSLAAVQAIGWYIEDIRRAQVSLNITDMAVSPLHLVFEEVKKIAIRHNCIVTGSELIGLIPKDALLDTANYLGAGDKSEEEKIDVAVAYLGLEEIKPFVRQKRILEYALNIEHIA